MSSQNGSVKAHRRLTPSTARRLAWIAIVVVAWVAHRHVVQKPILFNDDFILLGSAYTLPRFWAELFVPHNGHLCPLARTVSLIASHCTPSFSAIVYVLIVIKIAFFAYAVWSLTALMRAMRFGWRARALAAAVFAGTGSFASAVDWYSASFGLLAAALALHSGALTLRYLRNGRPVHLVLAVTSAVLATASYGSGAVAGLIALAAAVTAGRPGFRRVLAGGLPLIAIGVTVLVLRFLAPARDDLLTTDLGLVAGAVFQKIGALVLQHNLRLVGATGLGWTIGVLAALLTAAVWSLSDRVGRRAVMLAGVALFGSLLIIAIGRVEIIGVPHLLWCERYNVFGQASIALLAAAAARSAVLRHAWFRPVSTSLIPLACLLPLALGQQRPASREAFRHDRESVRQSSQLVDRTAAIAAKHQITPDQLMQLAYVPFNGGYFNGAAFYRGNHNVRALTMAVAREFWREWIAAARESGVDRWSHRLLVLANRPPVPPATLAPNEVRLKIVDHLHPISVVGAKRLKGGVYRTDAETADVSFGVGNVNRPELLSLDLRGENQAVQRVRLSLLDEAGITHGHLQLPPEKLGETLVDLRRLPWRTTVPIKTIRISVPAPRGTVFRVRFLAIASTSSRTPGSGRR